MVAYIVWRKVRARIRKIDRVPCKSEYFIRKVRVHTRKMTQSSSTGSAQLLPMHIFYCMLIEEIIFFVHVGHFHM